MWHGVLASLESSFRLQGNQMKVIQRVIYTGFAAVALASAATPTFSHPPVRSTDAVVRGVDTDEGTRAIIVFERR